MRRFGLSLTLALGALSCGASVAMAQAPAAKTVSPAASTSSTTLAANEPRSKGAHHTHEARSKSALPVASKGTPELEKQATPPLPERKTAKASPIAPPPPDVWTPAEIETAKAHCTEVLKGLDAIVEPQPPIKEGACGTPAPVRLLSLGKVKFEPAALVNCNMLVPLNAWINGELQPLAAKQLGAKIVKVDVMSDYSCRTAFGRVGHKLSEHAYVDALDIRGFVTEKNQTVHVLDAWGATNRDLVAAAAAAKAQSEKLATAQADAAKAGQQNLRDPKASSDHAQPPTAVASSLGTPGSGLVKPTRAEGVDKVTVTLPGGVKSQSVAMNAARLGGPETGKRTASTKSAAEKQGKKPDVDKVAALSPDALSVPPTGPRARFLRSAHAAACRIFGTTLGPEANEAHRNHFHVDMAERKYKKICD